MSKKCEHIKDISDKTLDELLTFKDAILFLMGNRQEVPIL